MNSNQRVVPIILLCSIMYLHASMKYWHKIQELWRSSPDVFESHMQKRDEVKRQPMGYSNQGEFIKCMEEKVKGLGSKTSKGGFTKDETLD